MAHQIEWLKPGRVLYVRYQGYQTPETLLACLDDMAEHLDQVQKPVAVLISWEEVTDQEPGTLLSQRGHRVYSHPMAARGVLVGFGRSDQFQNEISSVTTRGDKNTHYVKDMNEALDYLQDMLKD